MSENKSGKLGRHGRNLLLAAVALGSGTAVGMGCSSDPETGSADAAPDALVVGLPAQEAGPGLPPVDSGGDTRDGLPPFDAGLDAREAGLVDAGTAPVDAGND